MIKKQIHTSLKDQLVSRANDRLHTFILDEGNIRGAMVNATLMVNEMRTNHGLGILETLVLGHGFIGGALISVYLKGHDKTVLEMGGVIKSIGIFNSICIPNRFHISTKHQRTCHSGPRPGIFRHDEQITNTFNFTRNWGPV